MIDLDDVKGNSRDRAPSASDLVAIYKPPEKKWVTIRVFGGMQPEAGYWVKTKKKGGKAGKFYTPCPSFDPATQERDSTKYDPWRDIQMAEADKIRAKEMDRDDGMVQFASHMWVQVIVRAEQKKRPADLPKPTKAERKSGFKDKDSDTWTAKRVMKIGKSLAGKLKDLKPLNLVKSKDTGATKAFSVTDLKYGRDVSVYFDPSKPPADQYQVQLGEKRTPLTAEEQEMLGWDLTKIGVFTFDPKAVKADFEGWASRNGVKVKASKKSKAEDEDDEDSDSDDMDDEDEDEPKSKKSKGKPAKADKKAKGKKSKDEGEDDEDGDDSDSDDFDDEDEDEDDAPKSKKSKGKPAKGKKSKNDEDEEDDEDSDDEDDESDSDDEDDDEESDDDDDSDSDEDDEDDFDDEPAPKKGKKADKKAKGKKSKDEDDDDDFDDEEDSDSDDEDDEDDEPKPKKKAKGKSKPEPKKVKKSDKKSKGKKSKNDDDDDDIPF